MKQTSIYLTVRVDVEYPSDIMTEDEAKEMATQEFDYDFKLSEDTQMSVADTEICGIND